MWFVFSPVFALSPLTMVSLGAKLVYLPLYSPDFNPIEAVFLCIKYWVRHHKQYVVDDEALVAPIEEVAMSITPDDVYG
jgi:hypothetical protein